MRTPRTPLLGVPGRNDDMCAREPLCRLVRQHASDWYRLQPRANQKLYEWYLTVVEDLKRGQRSTEQLCTAIFGEDEVTSNSDRPRVASSSRAERDCDDEEQEEDVRTQKRRRV